MHDPSFSQRRPSFGCFYGTFIPSCRHILSTRFTFMAHPASRSDPAIAVVAVLAGDGDDVRGQCILVGASAWRLPLRRATLAHNATVKAFGDPEFPSDVINACSAAGGAQMGYSGRVTPTDRRQDGLDLQSGANTCHSSTSSASISP